MNLKTTINTNVSCNYTESQRDHEWDERAPPQNDGGARIYGESGRF